MKRNEKKKKINFFIFIFYPFSIFIREKSHHIYNNIYNFFFFFYKILKKNKNN